MNTTLLFLRTALKSVVALLFLIASGVVVSAQTCTTNLPTTTRHLIDNFNGTVSDPKTGLIWKKCSEGQSYISTINSCNNAATAYTWVGALQQALSINAGLSGEALGQDDWRVPNIKELVSIVERTCTDPAINEYVFLNTPSTFYWSSSPNADNSNVAWSVVFNSGSYGTMTKTSGRQVRLVRNAQ